MSIAKPQSPMDRLIVALDVSGIDEARKIVAQLGDSVSFYKIGYQLAYSGGFDLIRELKADGKKVFLDLKLLDIDNTIEKGVISLAALGVDMLTLHAYPKAMRAAVKAVSSAPHSPDGNDATCLLGVTVLTSMDDSDLKAAGYAKTAAELVLARACDAKAAGMGGIVASAMEAAAIREEIGDDMALVTPGIRPAGSNAGDQKRVVSPADAINAGASHLVVGRPIVAARDPSTAAREILEEIESTLAGADHR